MTMTVQEETPLHLRVHNPGEARMPFAKVRPSMTLMDVAGKLYRVEFWCDQRWSRMPESARPPARRAPSDDGWFLLTSL